MWFLEVPYGKDAASLISEMVALVLDVSIYIIYERLTTARSSFSCCLYG